MSNKFHRFQSPPHVLVNYINDQHFSSSRSQICSNKASPNNYVGFDYYRFGSAPWANTCESKGSIPATVVCKSRRIEGKNEHKVEGPLEILNPKYVEYLCKNALVSVHLYQCIVITGVVVKIRVGAKDIWFPSPVDYGSVMDFHKLKWSNL